MAFRFSDNIGSVLRGQATETRVIQSARTLGLSSITKGEGSLDLLTSDDAASPSASMGDLPDGSFGVGAVIDGKMENIATYSRTMKREIATERSRNDSQDKTLSSHDTRITAAKNRADKGVADAAAAQSTANSAVSKANAAQSTANSAVSKADAAQSTANSAASSGSSANSAISDLQSEISDLKRRVKKLEDKPDGSVIA